MYISFKSLNEWILGSIRCEHRSRCMDIGILSSATQKLIKLKEPRTISIGGKILKFFITLQLLEVLPAIDHQGPLQ